MLVGLALRIVRLSSTICSVVRNALYLAERLVGKSSAVVKSSLRVMKVSKRQRLSISASRSLGGGSCVVSSGGSGGISPKFTFFLPALSLGLLLLSVALAFAATLVLAEELPGLAMVKVVMGEILLGRWVL